MSERAAAIVAQWEPYQHRNLIYRNSLEGRSCPSVVKIMFAALINCYLTPTCSRMSFLTMGGCSLIALTHCHYTNLVTRTLLGNDMTV